MRRRSSNPTWKVANSFTVRLPRVLYVCAWFTIVTFHGFNALYLAGVASMYWYIVTPEMLYAVPTLNLPSPPMLEAIGAVFAAMAVAHAVEVFRIGMLSLIDRRLRLPGSWFSIFPWDRCRPEHRETGSFSRLRAASGTLSRWRRSAFTIESSYFDVSFAVREIIEIVLQTYQGYSLSLNVSRTWIINCAVATIVLNCLWSPIIYRLSKTIRLQQSQRRLLCVTCDAILDFTNAVFVPIVVFLPYWVAFDSETHTFVSDLTYDDVWFTNAVQENRQLFVLNPVDFVSSVAPHVNVLLSLNTIKRLVIEAPTTNTVAPSHVRLNTSPKTKEHRSPEQLAIGPNHNPLELQPTPPQTKRLSLRRLMIWLAHLWSLAWAALVIGVHLHAQMLHDPVAGCRLHNIAWFAKKYSCAVMELNFHQLGARGDKVSLASVLEYIEPQSISLLSFSHCPDLHVPPEIRECSQLYGLVAFNVTIEEWGDDAAFHEDFHRQLNYVVLVDTNFSNTDTLPHALSHSSLPRTLQDVEIARSSLRYLPEDIDVVWPNLYTLYVEFTEVEAVPASLFRLRQLTFLSLAGNRLRELPPTTLSDQSDMLQELTLSANPLMSLPALISPRIFASLYRM